MKKTILLITLLPIISLHAAKKGLVIVPVADLVCDPLGKTSKETTIEKKYLKMPVCGGSKNPELACQRTHQLLFNELVEIVGQKGDEIRVAIPNLYFVTPDQKKHTYYWTLKKNILVIEDSVELAKVPQPMSFDKPTTLDDQAAITLIFPHFDQDLGMTFSAGTRFVQAHKDEQHYFVYAYQNTSKSFKIAQIPTTKCVQIAGLSPQQRIAHFVTILQTWSHLHDGLIPYVWGGSSFIAPHKASQFEEIFVKKPREYSFFEWQQHHGLSQSGFDCTGLVSRVAQMCGIPYFFKNSVTVKTAMQPLTHDEAISTGDLIWVPGHLMVIADMQKNTIIEARHYAHGYGRIHEIPISKVFKNIETFSDLKVAYLNKKQLLRMDKQGTVKDTFKEFKILPMANAWRNSQNLHKEQRDSV